MTLKEYLEKLKYFDWFYMMSDDNGYYVRGQRDEYELKSLHGSKPFGPIFKRMYEDYHDYMFSGPAYDTPLKDMPKLEHYTHEC